MKKHNLNEVALAAVISGLVGAYIVSKLRNDNTKANNIRKAVSKLDADIESDLAMIDKKIQKEKEMIKKKVAKMNPKDRKNVERMAAYFN